MKFDPRKHHRRSIRLQGYDYTRAGGYFVTIVAYHRVHLFGEIVKGKMIVNKFGRVVMQQWNKLPYRFHNIELGAFVVMPNHVHGIIVINDAGRGTAEDFNDPNEETPRRAPTEHFGKPIPGSIPTIVRSFKSAVSYRINLMRGTREIPVWQRNYHERILRDHHEWDRIHRYIESNPSRWSEDDENPGKLK